MQCEDKDERWMMEEKMKKLVDQATKAITDCYKQNRCFSCDGDGTREVDREEGVLSVYDPLLMFHWPENNEEAFICGDCVMLLLEWVLEHRTMCEMAKSEMEIN